MELNEFHSNYISAEENENRNILYNSFDVWFCWNDNVVIKINSKFFN